MREWWERCRICFYNWLERRKSFVDFLTLIVLTATLCFVIKYACAAEEQNRHLADSVEQQVLINRPVIFGHGLVEAEYGGENPEIPQKVGVPFVNFGRSVAPEAVAVGHLFVRKPTDPTPHDPAGGNRNTPWPIEPKMTAIATSEKDASGECLSQQNCAIWWWTPYSRDDVTLRKGDVLYAAGCIYYKGLDGRKWFTDYCVIWDGGSGFPSCNDKTRNLLDPRP